MVTTRRLPYTPTETIVEPTLIQFPDEFPLTDELLMQLSAVNEVLPLERDAEGRLIVNFPAGAESNRFEKEFAAQLGNLVAGGSHRPRLPAPTPGCASPTTPSAHPMLPGSAPSGFAASPANSFDATRRSAPTSSSKSAPHPIPWSVNSAK